MTTRWAIGATACATGCIALAYASAFWPGVGRSWGPWLMVVGLATMVVALMALGAVGRARRLGRLVVPLVFTFVVLVGGFALALLLPAEGAGARVVLGLPVRAAVVLYGVGLLPLLVLPIAYALTFDAVTLSAGDLERVRALGAARRGDDGAREENE